MKKNFFPLISLVLILFSITGCGAEFKQPAIENYGMVGVMGYGL